MFASVFKSCRKVNFSILLRHHSRLSYSFLLQKQQLKTNSEDFFPIISKYSFLSPLSSNAPLEFQRYYAKKKKSSKKQLEEDEESEEEDEDFESIEPDEIGDTFNIMTKSLPSLRVDSIVKAGLGITKKKVEKEFYANRIRINGQKILKKATTIHTEDEIDLVKGYSPENQKFLLVDRIVIKGIGKVTQNGNFPVKMQIFKELTIENYPDAWSKMDVLESA
ncbi:mitochondrial transcription rescue factor 1-like [Argiope bruennichi]|uniref:Mitochondrial transcription rescue factor 1 like protein n=1 Tax=Argiope bruennichi TaxID=94029 RepID=A0A8T0E0Z8_ARGBR|nr:mitochondrial transcription rescue factor 1-like [Argiope bruennichi]KAF8764402.1 Mitochondrial transcription rescue factor 1 like protein [Argiope bruennichi]